MAFAVGVLICSYFMYHTVHGNRSFGTLMGLCAENAALELSLQSAVSTREALEYKVIAMRPGHLTRDLLEQRAREVLGYRAADEIELP